MANHALALLENALRARRLDRTLTTALAPLERTDPASMAATHVAALDACLRPSTGAQGGGFPRGQLSDIVGPRSSGRTMLLLRLMAAATQRGEIVALVDPLDQLDVASAVDAGIDLDRLLWIRGSAVVGATHASPLPTILERALKALNLVLQAGGFGLVALDVVDVPHVHLMRLPFTTWMRVQRVIEGSDTACVLIASQPLARSAGGVTLSLTGRAQWTESRFLGLDITARAISPRQRVHGEAYVRGAVRS
jgi:hypothetical protein